MTCTAAMHSAPPKSPQRDMYAWVGMRCYGSFFYAETNKMSRDNAAVMVHAPVALSFDGLANSSAFYTEAESILVARYRKQSCSTTTNLFSALNAIGHIRSLKAKPLVLDYLRKTNDLSPVMLAHQQALRGIGLPLPEIIRELDDAKDNPEWVTFLCGLGWDTEGEVFTRAVNRHAAGAADAEKWKCIQAALAAHAETHPAPEPLIVPPPRPRIITPPTNKPDIPVDTKGL